MFILRKHKSDLGDNLRIQQTPHNCLFLLMSHNVLHYHFEKVILSILNLHVLIQ